MYLHSDPVLLGHATADANGNFVATYALPANTALGSHQVLLQGTNQAGDPTTVTLELTVTASGSLPRTGGSVGPLLFGAMALLAAGLLLARRRRLSPR